MKYTTALLSFLIFLALSLPALSKEPQNSSELGETVYKAHCEKCHGISGKGDGPEATKLIVPPTNFQRFESRIKSDKALRAAIIWGLAFSPMHGWWGKLSGIEIHALAAYIRQLAPYQPWRP